ncbi:MAG: hypothetical protein DVB33_06655 [Verrucomicrobia bacterium]|nr:MAG: hypothetical protein DVB33_06655 [Verrucomicrobiota bacterium]
MIFFGNKKLADSVNHLLLVWFYPINIGYETLALKRGLTAVMPQECLESLSAKIGMVLLMLGFIHFFNLHADGESLAGEPGLQQCGESDGI